MISCLMKPDALLFRVVLVPESSAGFSLWCVNRGDKVLAMIGHGDSPCGDGDWVRVPQVLGVGRAVKIGEWTGNTEGDSLAVVVRWVVVETKKPQEKIGVFPLPGMDQRHSKDLRYETGLRRNGFLLKAMGPEKTQRFMRENGWVARVFDDFTENFFDDVLMQDQRFHVQVRPGNILPPHEPVPNGLIEQNKENEALFSFLLFSLEGQHHESTLGLAVIRDENNPSGSLCWSPDHVRDDLEKALSYMFTVYRDSLRHDCPWTARCGRDVSVRPVMEKGYTPDRQAFYARTYFLALHDRPLRDLMVFIDPRTLMLLFLLDGFLAWEAGLGETTWFDYFYDHRRLPKQRFYTQSDPPCIDQEKKSKPLPNFKAIKHPNTFRKGRFRTWTDFGQRILWFFEERLNREAYCPVTHHFVSKDRAELYAVPKDIWPELYPGPDGISPYAADCQENHWSRDILLDWHFPYAVRGDESVWVIWPGKRNLFVMRWVLLVSSEDMGCFPTGLKRITDGDLLFRRAVQCLLAQAMLTPLSEMGGLGLGKCRISPSSHGFMPRYTGVHLIHPDPERFELVWNDPASGIQLGIPMNRECILEWYIRQPPEIRGQGDILPPMPYVDYES